jgi:3-isopropylmalate dehydrogenase
MILSAALMLRYGLDRPVEAERLEGAVAHARTRTPTIDAGGTATTAEFGDCVLSVLHDPELVA